MQIDFHFSVTYTVARMAGFNHDDAHTVAYASQYVDDATNSGQIRFDNGAMYNRVSSAHKMLDYRNLADLANHYVWIPFHFLPGNGGLPPGENPEGSFIEKIVCRPNSVVAQDMVDTCISHKDKPYSLQLLGITSHVLCDTYAHQGFAGVTHEINRISKITDDDPNNGSIIARLSEFFGDIFDRKASKIISDVSPLGHGAALSNPDLPYLTWSYKDWKGNTVDRDNSTDFVNAADTLYQVYRQYLGLDVSPMSDENRQRLLSNFKSFTDKEGDKRNEKWIDALTAGKLGFDVPQLSYAGKGRNSWKYQAVGTEKEIDLATDEFSYSPDFLNSKWKLFHDALQLHRYYIIHDILPKYGICVA